jgi:hypothetical protein
MATAISGFITIATAGTAIAGPATGPGTFVLMTNPANTGTYCYVGNDGADDVASGNGYPLSKTLGNQVVVTVGISGLAGYRFDSDTNNDDIIYLRIAGEGDAPPAA